VSAAPAPEADEPSRRRVLALGGAGLAGASAAVLAACGAHRNHVKADAKPTPRDVGLLAGLLDLEQKTVAAYEAGIPLLDATSAPAAEQFLRHELSHVGELAGLIKKAGAKPQHPRLYDLGHPHSAEDVLALLHRLESSQLRAYLATLPRLSGGPVRAALAAVLANDAQHVAVLRALQRQAPAPSAFVTGRE